MHTNARRALAALATVAIVLPTAPTAPATATTGRDRMRLTASFSTKIRQLPDLTSQIRGDLVAGHRYDVEDRPARGARVIARECGDSTYGEYYRLVYMDGAGEGYVPTSCIYR